MIDARITALGYFKDWSNYLLVTSVASLGWVSTKMLGIDPWVHNTSVIFFAASVVFGIFTLALIPIVAQNLAESTTFYDVTVTAKPVPILLGERKFKIKYVCWPQHVFFILGIAFYAYGVTFAELRPLATL